MKITSLLIFNGFLFVGFLNPGLPGQNAGFIHCYNLNSSAMDCTQFQASQDFPAAHQGEVIGIAIAGDKVVSAGSDGQLKLWGLQGTIWSLQGIYGGTQSHAGPITALLSIQDVLLSSDKTGLIKIWSTAQGNQINQLQATTGSVIDLEYWQNDDMKVLMSCGEDGIIKAWDFSKISETNLQPVFEFPSHQNKFFSSLTATKLQNSQAIIVCGYSDGSLQIFTLPEFEEYGFLRGHRRQGMISSISKIQQGMLFAGTAQGKLICYETV